MTRLANPCRFLMAAWGAMLPVALACAGIGLPTAAPASPSARGIPATAEAPAFDNTARTYRLWPGRAPGASSSTVPVLNVVRPAAGWRNGTAVVIAPGGGYVSLSLDLEGAQPAQWFASRGITAFVLTYRVDPAMLPTPLLDGERAMRFVRAHAADFGIDPARIGMMGFSAGGHLAAMTAARASDGEARAVDPVDRASSRPDFLILAYPWLEATMIGPNGSSPYCDFARTLAHVACDARAYTALVPSRLVRAGAPPAFLYHTDKDGLVPADGTVRYYLALRQARVPAELHVFEPGEHGSGMGGSNAALSHWPMLLQEWLRQRGVLPPPGKGEAYP